MLLLSIASCTWQPRAPQSFPLHNHCKIRHVLALSTSSVMSRFTSISRTQQRQEGKTAPSLQTLRLKLSSTCTFKQAPPEAEAGQISPAILCCFQPQGCGQHHVELPILVKVLRHTELRTADKNNHVLLALEVDGCLHPHKQHIVGWLLWDDDDSQKLVQSIRSDDCGLE